MQLVFVLPRRKKPPRARRHSKSMVKKDPSSEPSMYVVHPPSVRRTSEQTRVYVQVFCAPDFIFSLLPSPSPYNLPLPNDLGAIVTSYLSSSVALSSPFSGLKSHTRSGLTANTVSVVSHGSVLGYSCVVQPW